VRLFPRNKQRYSEPGTGDPDVITSYDLANPTPDDTRSPMGSYNGLLTANPHTIQHYANDLDNTPITYNRLATRWADMQLKNGLANGVASGKIWGYRGEGWYDVVVPVIPGQSRLIGGGLPGNYPIIGPAPSQVQNQFNTGPGSQPDYPSGPGSTLGGQLYNPGSGG